MKFGLLVLSLFFFCFSFSQELPNDLKERLTFIYELSSIDLDQALSETQKLVKQYENDKFNQARVYLVLVQIKGAKGQKEEALELCKQALILSQKYNKSLVSRFKSLLIECYTENFMYDEALAISEELLREINNETLMSTVRQAKLNLANLNQKINRNKVALQLILEVYNNSDLTEDDNRDLKLKLILDIADLYNTLGKSDSTAYYLNVFEQKFSIASPEMLKSFELKVRGNVFYVEGRYKEAIELYRTYLQDYSSFFQDEDVEIGLKKCSAFFELKQYDSVLTNLQFLSGQEDFEKKLSRKSLASYYKLYADVYLQMDNRELSDSYLKKHFEALDEFNKSRFETQEGLYEIKTQEILAEGEQTEKKYKNYITFISSILGFLILAGISFYLIKTKKNQKRFGELMATVEAYEQKKQVADASEKISIVEELPRNMEREAKREKEKTELELPIETEIKREEIENKEEIEEIEQERSADTSPIKDEKIQELLEKLEKLKASDYFLRQDSSLYNTAKRLKTNTSYLSSVINNTMNTNFNRFVNDIRMDYVILELKNNKRMRSYSVKGIAEEIGYKSADSFTKYFKESTGLSPSAFIRNLNKEFKI